MQIPKPYREATKQSPKHHPNYTCCTPYGAGRDAAYNAHMVRTAAQVGTNPTGPSAQTMSRENEEDNSELQDLLDNMTEKVVKKEEDDQSQVVRAASACRWGTQRRRLRGSPARQRLRARPPRGRRRRLPRGGTGVAVLHRQAEHPQPARARAAMALVQASCVAKAAGSMTADGMVDARRTLQQS